jgi:hypothetical protein
MAGVLEAEVEDGVVATDVPADVELVAAVAVVEGGLAEVVEETEVVVDEVAVLEVEVEDLPQPAKIRVNTSMLAKATQTSFFIVSPFYYSGKI